MAMNYAEQYAPYVDERFALGSLTGALINNQFSWIGVQSVKIFSRNLATLNDYKVTGSNRYGEPDELGNDVQEMVLSQDATLAENVTNLIIPAMDTYRLSVLVANAPTAGAASGNSHIITDAVSASNAYEVFLKCQEVIDDDKAPQGGRIAVVTPAYLNMIKLDEHYTKWGGDMATRLAINGIVGEIDGIPTIKVPTSYMPEGTDLIITNPLVAPSPVKLTEFKINYNAPGISGALVEARVRYDCFVLGKKADAIAVHTVTGA